MEKKGEREKAGEREKRGKRGRRRSIREYECITFCQFSDQEGASWRKRSEKEENKMR